MPKRIIANVHFENGAMTVSHKAQLAAQIAEMPNGPGLMTIERMTRTNAQNRYYWGVVVNAIAEETKNDPDAIHEVLKAKFNPITVTFANDKGEIVDEIEGGGSTASMTLDVFAEYVDHVKNWARDFLGITIPEAGEYQEENP